MVFGRFGGFVCDEKPATDRHSEHGIGSVLYSFCHSSLSLLFQNHSRTTPLADESIRYGRYQVHRPQTKSHCCFEGHVRRVQTPSEESGSRHGWTWKTTTTTTAAAAASKWHWWIKANSCGIAQDFFMTTTFIKFTTNSTVSCKILQLSLFSLFLLVLFSLYLPDSSYSNPHAIPIPTSRHTRLARLAAKLRASRC